MPHFGLESGQRFLQQVQWESASDAFALAQPLQPAAPFSPLQPVCFFLRASLSAFLSAAAFFDFLSFHVISSSFGEADFVLADSNIIVQLRQP